MNNAEIFRILIIAHAALGGASLLSGFVAAITKKGSRSHIISGQIFYYSLGGSILLSLIAANMPDHYNPFLFSIGIFSGYFILIGKRAIKYKVPTHGFNTDRIIHVGMIITCILMASVPLVIAKSFHIVAGVFGLLGFIFAMKNLLDLRNIDQVKKNWLKMHIGNMSGGYIASVTAFVVVNNFLPGVYSWFVPSIIGGMFIYFSIKRVDNLNKVKTPYPSFTKTILTLIFGYCTIFSSSAQNDAVSIPYGKEIGIRVGISKTKVNDQRLSAKSFTNWSHKYGITFGTRKVNSWSRNQLDFTYVKGHKKDPYFTINSLIISHTYSYQRRVKEGFWAGGFTNHRSIINFPKSLYKSVFTNNSISYTIAQSIGPKISYSSIVLPQNQRNIEMQTSIEAAVVAYLIQPIYGHPYPRRYLEEGTFDPTRAGMALPMLKSGKFVSISRYKGFKIELSLFYYTSDKFKIGASYQGELLYANANGKAVKLQSNDFIVNPCYLY
ncbi:MAG TPA: hypothetical protein PKD51_14865 [Saprospiraceae bacterium]|nr:hypothetical protein [Saprospiraceae bacterium]